MVLGNYAEFMVEQLASAIKISKNATLRQIEEQSEPLEKQGVHRPSRQKKPAEGNFNFNVKRNSVDDVGGLHQRNLKAGERRPFPLVSQEAVRAIQSW
ncbi:hypothetical protein Ancab_019134 [Ancistrocladus abbreviatus]